MEQKIWYETRWKKKNVCAGNRVLQKCGRSDTTDGEIQEWEGA